MAVLKQGVPITQDDPVLVVENRLAEGRHQFQLEVIDDAGLVSEPAMLVVTVTAPAPTPTPTRTTTINPGIFTRVATATTTRVTPVTLRKPIIR